MVTKYGDYGCTREKVHPLYDAWRNMKRRCYLKTAPYYKNYGGRGIRVCDEWKNDYKSFLEWSLSNGWSKGMQLDRIDNNGNYEPLNCRWITQQRNLLNKRTNTKITYNGRSQTVTEWANELGIHVNTLRKRIAKWGIESAFSTPIDKRYSREVSRRYIEFNGKTKTLTEWAREIGISHVSLEKRIKNWGVEEALTRPVQERYKR